MKTNKTSAFGTKTVEITWPKSIMGCFIICFLLLTSSSYMAYDNHYTFATLTVAAIEYTGENMEELSKEVSESPGGFLSRMLSFVKQMIMIIILLAAIGLSFYFIRFIFNNFRQLRLRMNNLEKRINQFSEQNAFNGYDQLELKQLQRSIQYLSDDIDELKSKERYIDEYKSEKPTTSQVEENKNKGDDDVNESTKKFFMPPPGESNYFLSHNKSYHLDTDKHAFEFLLSNDTDNKAYFNLIMDQTIIEKALNYPNPFLKNACEIENFYINDPSKIKNVKPGIAEKNEDKWVIIHKSEIRYE